MTTRQRVRLAGIAAVLVGGIVALLLVDRSSQLDKAIGRLGDDGRFTTSAKAGQTVADISTQLRVDGTKCRERDGADARCSALLSAAGFTAVAAVSMLDCTAPDVHDSRVSLQKYLRALRDFIDDGAKGAAPVVPKVVTC